MRVLPRLLLVGLIIGIMFYPWAAPAKEIRLSGFDQGYLYVDEYGRGSQAGTVEFNRDQLNLTTVPDSEPTLILAGSTLPFSVDFDLNVNSDSEASFPFQAVVFYPGTDNRVSLWYHSLEKWIRADIERSNYTDRVQPKTLAHYAAGATHIRIEVVPQQHVQFILSNSTWTATYKANTTYLGALLSAERRAVQILASGGPSESGISSSVSLTNLEITVSNGSTLWPLVQDKFAFPAYMAVSVAILLVLRTEFALFTRQALSVTRRTLSTFPRLLWILMACSISVGILISGIANHPYDIYAEQVYVYTIMTDGLGAIYIRPTVTAAATPFGGAPWSDASYVYPPLSGYYFLLVSTVVSPLGPSNVSPGVIEFVIKALGLVAVAIGGFITYVLVSKMGGSRRVALLGTGLSVFNPALVYDTAIWGQTDSLIVTMLLASALFLLTGKNRLFWVLASAAVLTKQTALVPAVVMMAFSVRTKGLRGSVEGFSACAGTLFLLLLPYFLLGFAPQSAVLPFYNVPASLRVTLSRDAYSFLPLLSALDGFSGRTRMAVPAAALIPGTPISYSFLGVLLFSILAIPIFASKIRPLSKEISSKDLFAVGTITLLSVFFLPGASSRYFALAVSLLIPCIVILRDRVAALSVVILTATATFSMHGLLLLWSKEYPGIFSGLSASDGLGTWLLSLYLSDQAITIGILANLAAILGVTQGALRWWSRPNVSSSSRRWFSRFSPRNFAGPQH